jgi:hypothetical protein
MEDLVRLRDAQLKHASERIASEHYSDDGYDYLQTALQLAHDIVVIERNEDVEGLHRLLKNLDGYVGYPDGICDLILAMEDEGQNSA